MTSLKTDAGVLGDPESSAPEAEPEPARTGADDTRAAGEETSRDRAPGSRWLGGFALVVTLASLVGPISASGIWDPFELKTAELSRRIALTLLGAKSLAIEGANNSVPTLGELGRGQLPFTSVAAGFKLFGLHEWAGRLPLALWGIAGVLAIYALVSRLSDRIAGAFTALALVTMPLFFLHARTMLGDVVTMSAFAFAAAGLGLLVFDREAETRKRIAWGLLGLVGLAAGFGARGALIGIAAPALGIGLAWLIVRLSSENGGDKVGDFSGALVAVLGLACLVVGWRALLRSSLHPNDFSQVLGVSVENLRKLPTYDDVIHDLGFGLFPWSAVLPFAAGRMMRPPHGLSGRAAERETALRAVLLLTSATAFGVFALLAPTVGMLPFAGVAALAGIAGVALRDFDRGAPASRVLAMGVAAFAILFYYDFKNFPEKGLVAFVVENPRFPDSFKEPAHGLLKIATLVLVALFFASVMEHNDPKARRFERDDYLAWPRALKTEWAGNLWFSFLVVEAALVGYAALTWLSQSRFHWKQFETLGPPARAVASYGWLVLPVLVLVLPPLVLLGRDLSRWAFSILPISRGTVATLSVVFAGSVMSFGYYPKLAAQISPKEVFDSYKRYAQPGEALGIVGVGSGTATYYAGRDVPTFDNPTSAFTWLTSGQDRRWLVVRSSDLPQINAAYRGLPNAPGNVPVIDARSSEILLLSNRLASGQKNDNPFDDWILDRPPTTTHPLDANLGGQLDVVGWDVTALDGKPVASVTPGKLYDFRIYYKVVAPISGNWETFIHIDGFQRRFNGDHKTLDNKYPLHLWRIGDYVADIYEFSLEPNFTPGAYEVFFGLFIGSRRLDVKRGRHNDNRVQAGHLEVR
jgi:4-amino-4-deoxy-L-arabinose transferase-like glycosyltransferase